VKLRALVPTRFELMLVAASVGAFVVVIAPRASGPRDLIISAAIVAAALVVAVAFLRPRGRRCNRSGARTSGVWSRPLGSLRSPERRLSARVVGQTL
jgi:Flp pilus assembly protein TadB